MLQIFFFFLNYICLTFATPTLFFFFFLLVELVNVLILSNIKPETVSDLNRSGTKYIFASINKVEKDDVEENGVGFEQIL